MRHLVTISELDSEQIEHVLDRAEALSEVAGREIKKVPALRGRTVVNLFYEASTRTSSSFELAALRLSADVVTVRAQGSSVEKGESLKDTIQTLSAYDPSVIVMRTPFAGAPALAKQFTDAAIVNAGDGKHAHPTQALLDLFVMRRKLGSLEGKNVVIVGDILHSRVARSLITGLAKLGAIVTVCGPPTLIPREVEELGCAVAYSFEQLDVEPDVVYALRMQQERMDGGLISSSGEYIKHYQVTPERLGAAWLMHPGPVNRGVELSGEVIDSERALIEEQVRAGVAVRMAVLFEVVSALATHDKETSTGETQVEAESLEEVKSEPAHA